MDGWVSGRFQYGGAADVIMQNGDHVVLFREEDTNLFKVRRAFNRQVIATFSEEMFAGLTENEVRQLIAIAVRAHLHDEPKDNTRVIRRLAEIGRGRVAC